MLLFTAQGQEYSARFCCIFFFIMFACLVFVSVLLLGKTCTISVIWRRYKTLTARCIFMTSQKSTLSQAGSSAFLAQSFNSNPTHPAAAADCTCISCGRSECLCAGEVYYESDPPRSHNSPNQQFLIIGRQCTSGQAGSYLLKKLVYDNVWAEKYGSSEVTHGAVMEPILFFFFCKCG